MYPAASLNDPLEVTQRRALVDDPPDFPEAAFQIELAGARRGVVCVQSNGISGPCPGDGNLDKVVNLADVQNWFHFSTNGVPQPPLPPNTSSWYDFNKDGSTDEADLKIILMNFGKSCIPKK